MSTVSFTVKQTGSFEYTFTALDENDVAIDLSDPSNWTITSTARLTQDHTVTQAMTTAAVDLANGQFSVALTPTNTTSMVLGIWEFDAKMVSPDTLTAYFTETLYLEVKDNVT